MSLRGFILIIHHLDGGSSDMSHREVTGQDPRMKGVGDGTKDTKKGVEISGR